MNVFAYAARSDDADVNTACPFRPRKDSRTRFLVRSDVQTILTITKNRIKLSAYPINPYDLQRRIFISTKILNNV